jgi:hypothetical protein
MIIDTFTLSAIAVTLAVVAFFFSSMCCGKSN